MDAQVARRLLETERRRLVRLRRGLEEEHPHEPEAEAAAELSALDQHQADIGSEVFEREKDLSILGRVETDLRDVIDALARLDRGAYGTCQTCGRQISDDRLEAVPATRFCAEHEVLWEGSQMTVSLPAGAYPDGQPFADDLAAREAAEHLGFLPADDEDEDVRLGPEEGALHVTGLFGDGSETMTPEAVELAEMVESELEDEQRTDAAREVSAQRAEVEAAELEDEELDGTSPRTADVSRARGGSVEQ